MFRNRELMFPSTSQQGSVGDYYDQLDSDSSCSNGMAYPTRRSLHAYGETALPLPSGTSSSISTIESRARTPITANLVVRSAGTGSYTDATNTENGSAVFVDNQVLTSVRTATTNQSLAEPSLDEEEDDESVEENEPIVGNTQSTQTSTKQSQARRYILLTLTLMSLLAGIMVVSVLEFKKQGSHGKTSKIGTANTTTSVALSKRQQQLDIIIQNVSNVTTLAQLNSPQALARNWLLFDDQLQLDPINVTKDRVIQRYSLAVFYFATGGPSNWKANHWLRHDECGETIWNGLNCNEKQQARGIVLDNFGLAGTLPSELCLMSSLENLILKNNRGLEGTIPNEIFNLQQLVQLGLYNNTLNGTLPRATYGGTTLRFINLQGNRLTGTFFANVSQWTKLETLVLMNNRLRGSIPWEAIAKTEVRFLGLSENNFTGTINSSLSLSSSLQFLYLDGNRFTGSLPTEVGLLTSLQSLNLNHNNVSGCIPKQTGNLTKLTYLSMQDNVLTGSIPSEISRLTRLETINLATNSLIGSIPDFSKLKHLINIYLYRNRLSGSIPNSIFDLKQLEILFLSSNHINGSIPTSIVKLRSTLRGLYLSENEFDGSIPSDICSLTALEALFIDTNQISGALPSCVGALRRLRQLYAFQNKLSGSIPSGLANLTLLEGLGLENNYFVGNMPSGVCSLNATNLSDIWADCGGALPAVRCPCCTTCCPSSVCNATA